MRLLIPLCVAVGLALCSPGARASGEVEQGDQLWRSRAELLDGRLALPETIEAAIAHYRDALDRDGRSLEARWKLLRALHYLIDFSHADADRKEAAMLEATDLARSSLEILETSEADDSGRARLHFWSAIAWGARANRVGLLTIVREGVAGRMRDHAESALALEPRVERGGALRLLSRLHASLPRVPFVSGWVDRDQVLPLAERAFDLDGEHPGNRLVLALALLDRAPDRRGEAVRLLESVVAVEPDAAQLCEELAIRERARDRLAQLRREER